VFLEVSPVKVIMRMDTLYMIAADDDFEKTGVFKNFMVENISSVSMTNKPVEPGLVFDAATHYKYAFGKYTNTEPPQEISLLVKNDWLKTQFKKSHFNPTAQLRRDRNKNTIVDIKVRITPDFKTWLLGVRPDVEILKPASLKAEMLELVKESMKSLQG
jgi:predicted DNA-binding transcriptional regulator YafY